MLTFLFPSGHGCVPYSTLNRNDNEKSGGTLLTGMHALPTPLCSAGPARGKIWPINQAPQHGQRAAGSRCIVEGTAAPAGRGQTPTPAGGAGAGKLVARKAPPWGNVVAEKAHCPPHRHPGLGDTTVQACCLSGPTTTGEAAIHHQHSIAGRPAGHLDGTVPQVPGAKRQVLGLGQGVWGVRQQLKCPSLSVAYLSDLCTTWPRSLLTAFKCP